MKRRRLMAKKVQEGWQKKKKRRRLKKQTEDGDESDNSDDVFYGENENALAQQQENVVKVTKAVDAEHFRNETEEKFINWITQPLSNGENEAITNIIGNTEAKSDAEFYDNYKGDTVQWGSMRALLNFSEDEKTEKRLFDDVINFWFKQHLAQLDKERSENDTGHKQSGFFSSYFWQQLNDNQNKNMELRGKYNYNNVRGYANKVPGKNIFNLKNLFIPINISNNHWVLIVISMTEKMIRFYDSLESNLGNDYLKIIWNYLLDEKKAKHEGQQQLNPNDWRQVSKTERVPQQENKYDCGAFVCLFGYCIAHDCPLRFEQNDMTIFRKKKLRFQSRP